MTTIKLLTRQSPLAMWQTKAVEQALKQQYPALQVAPIPLSTAGDREQTVALRDIGGKNLFASDLRKCLEPGVAAVHSLKDLSVQTDAETCIAAVLPRADVHDALVTRFASLADLPQGARIGTASPRRQSQLQAYRPDLRCALIRGNVQTRLSKLDEGEYDAVVLAACGLMRLGLEGRITERLPIDFFTPAIGQGAIVVECAASDMFLKDILATIHCEQSGACVEAERSVNRYLGGDCFSAIAAYAALEGEQLTVHGFVGSHDGSTVIRSSVCGSVNYPTELGEALGKALESEGARCLLHTTDP